jgi:hypothetical protein
VTNATSLSHLRTQVQSAHDWRQHGEEARDGGPWTADITIVNPTPMQLGIVKSGVTALNRLRLDSEPWIPPHPPTPDTASTKADVAAAAGARAV